MHIVFSVVNRGKGGGGGSLPRAPSVRETPNNAELFQIRSGSSFTSQSSFLRGLFCCIVDLKSACFLFRAYAADTNFKNAHFILRDYCAGPVRRTFQSETTKRRRQLVGIYVLYACSKRSLRSPQNTLQSM